MPHERELIGEIVGGKGSTRQRGAKGRNWENCNSIMLQNILKIYIKINLNAKFSLKKKLGIFAMIHLIHLKGFYVFSFDQKYVQWARPHWWLHLQIREENFSDGGGLSLWQRWIWSTIHDLNLLECSLPVG